MKPKWPPPPVKRISRVEMMFDVLSDLLVLPCWKSVGLRLTGILLDLFPQLKAGR